MECVNLQFRLVESTNYIYHVDKTSRTNLETYCECSYEKLRNLQPGAVTNTSLVGTCKILLIGWTILVYRICKTINLVGK